MILQIVCIVSLVFVILSAYIRYCHAGRLMAKIPGPARVPLLGNFLAMYKSRDGTVDICRVGHRPEESIRHIITRCSRLANGEYLHRHNLVARIIHQLLACYSKIQSCGIGSTVLQNRVRMNMNNFYCGTNSEILKKYPFLWNYVEEQLFKYLREWRKSYGRLWRLDGIHIRTIHLYHPEDIEMILSSTAYNQKDLPYTFLQGWLGEGLLLSNGDKWHQRRKMLTPAFHFKILNKYLSVFCEHTQDFLVTIENEVGKERTDLIPLLTKATLFIMCETSLGTKVRETSSLDNYLQSIHNMGECIVKRLTEPWYLVNFIYELSPLARRVRSILPDLHNFTKQIIQKRRQSRNVDNSTKMNSKPALLDLLLDEEEKGTINDDGIREEVDTFLFEGHDTTATALTFMIMRIANEQEIQDSIYEELESIYGDSQRLTTIEDLSKMKYLECCIKESLRLYPSVPFLSRCLTKEVVIAGYRIPKNTFCDIHVFDIHRDPVVFPEPEKFVPERFLPQNAIQRNPYSYIPFSAGPRNCIGQKFAIMELKTLVSGVLRKYRLEPITKPEDLVFIADIVLRTNHPIYVRFHPRENLTMR